MVRKEPLVYLFAGEDLLSKDARLKKLKDQTIPRNTEAFNFDNFYGKDLGLHDLQKSLLALPVNGKKRLVVIRQAEALKKQLRDFILQYVRKPLPHVVLVVDAARYDFKDEFIKGIARYSNVLRFRETAPLNSFALARCIEQKKADYALKMLYELLKRGERPERILGGLRYGLLKAGGATAEERRRLKLFMRCDLEIKTGRLKPAWALERFVVGLCGLA